MNEQLQKLLALAEAEGLRLSRDYTRPLPNNVKLHCFRVVQTEPGDRRSPFLTAMVTEFEDGGYELFLPGTTNSIVDDVTRLRGK